MMQSSIFAGVKAISFACNDLLAGESNTLEITASWVGKQWS